MEMRWIFFAVTWQKGRFDESFLVSVACWEAEWFLPLTELLKQFTGGSKFLMGVENRDSLYSA